MHKKVALLYYSMLPYPYKFVLQIKKEEKKEEQKSVNLLSRLWLLLPLSQKNEHIIHTYLHNKNNRGTYHRKKI